MFLNAITRLIITQ